MDPDHAAHGASDELIDQPFVQTLGPNCEIIAEYECIDMFQATIKRNRLLGEGKIARVIIRKVPWSDAIPF